MRNRINNFAPGPWRFWKSQVPFSPSEIVDQNGDFVCQISMDNTQAGYNASLIAAAPEMFEALETLVAEAEAGCVINDSKPCVTIAREAILKAKG